MLLDYIILCDKMISVVLCRVSVVESALSSTDRVSGFGPEGWGFESLRAQKRRNVDKAVDKPWELCITDIIKDSVLYNVRYASP